ncbi:MAG: exopolysaccharide biosynthesis polyprenyl glycosylphosphotransferase [Chloroflexota bacterium]
MAQFTRSIVNPEVFKAPGHGSYRLRLGGFMLLADVIGLAARNLEVMPGIEAPGDLPHPLASALKRIVDFLGSALGILVLAPFFTLIAILIKLDSPGPVLYTQPRIGIDGKRIRMYKFRTMVVNAEQELEKVFQENAELRAEWEQTQKLREDPRITRIGKFLRKFSLDEFPQLLNVLLGDMSLVGPRPIMVDQVSVYGEAIHAYRAVRPGMTGLWQVSGRNQTTFRERSRFDVYYVRNWSVWLDAYILLRTIRVVLSHEGAY